MYQDFSIPLDPLIELLIRDGGVLNTDLVADDEGGFGAPGDDQVAQVAVVVFDVALAGC
jgi:hypothetical protein